MVSTRIAPEVQASSASTNENNATMTTSPALVNNRTRTHRAVTPNSVMVRHFVGGSEEDQMRIRMTTPALVFST